jgi:hypothetical protein
MTSQTGTVGTPPAREDGAIAAPGEESPIGLGVVSPAARLACPRCDHDLRAEPMGWRTGCPLAGRCPECGLDFSWSAVLSRRNALPRWSVEGGDGLGAWLRRWPAQAFMAAIRPGTVHRRLRLEHRRRPWRLAAALLPLLAAAVLAPMVGTGVASWRAGMGPGIALRDALQPLRSRASIRPVPIANVTVPGRVWILNSRTTGGWVDATSDWLQGQPSHSPAELATLRDAPNSVVRVQLPGGVVAGVLTDATGRVPPAAVAAFQSPTVLVAVQGPTPWWRTAAWMIRLGTFATPIVGVPILAAAAFMLLPVVRRRARVSGGHVVRLMLLGLMLALPLAFVVALVLASRGVGYGSWVILRPSWSPGAAAVDTELLRRIGGPTLIAAVLTFLWIRSAAVHHLRLERPTAVAIATTSVSIIGVLTIWLAGMVAT